MKRSICSSLFIVLFFSDGLHAQRLEDVLQQVEANNQILRAERQRLEASRVEYKTGLALYAPQITYDYMRGTPREAGHQMDLMINQPFDFPTAYAYRKKVSNLRTVQTDYDGALARRDILLEAKLVCMYLIYVNRRKTELSDRLALVKKFLTDYQRKFDQQDASILDLNKARLQMLTIQTDMNLLETERLERTQQLIELNGGQPIEFLEEVYPAADLPPSFDGLFGEIERRDPAFKRFEIQKEIGKAEVSLSKAMALPKLEAGYRYHAILGQYFNGLHTGINIPLWEKKNTVKLRHQQNQFFDVQSRAHTVGRFYEAKGLYLRAVNLQTQLNEFQQGLQEVSAAPLLDKALQAGQISTLEYFLELSLYYGSIDRFLQLELQYHEALTQLFKHEL